MVETPKLTESKNGLSEFWKLRLLYYYYYLLSFLYTFKLSCAHGVQTGLPITTGLSIVLLIQQSYYSHGRNLATRLALCFSHHVM